MVNRSINISVRDAANKTWEFNSTKELVSFLKREFKYWKTALNSLSGDGVAVHRYIDFPGNFESVINSVEDWTKDTDLDDITLSHRINGHLSNLNHQWLWSRHPYSKVFTQCNRKFGKDAAEAFINCIVTGQVDINGRERFFGTLVAYEFSKLGADILKRWEAEKTTFDDLKDDLETTKNDLIQEAENIKNEHNSWSKRTQQFWKTMLENFSNDFLNSQQKHDDKFAAYMSDRLLKIDTLQKTYQDMLRLKGPATYWKTAAADFKAQAKRWTDFLIISLISGVFLVPVFWGWIKEEQLNTPEAIVVVGTILTVYAFLIMILSRFAFSAHHLRRDAEEREQLTHLYLSLINETDISDASRNIILQALFSRSDSGLLKRESGPAMPGLGEMIKLFTK